MGRRWCGGLPPKPSSASTAGPAIRPAYRQVAEPRGAKIARVAAARGLNLVFYGMRDRRIRILGGGVTVRLRGSCCVVSSGRSSCRQAAMARGWHDSLGDARLPAQTRSCHRPVGINVVVDFSVGVAHFANPFDGIRRTERHRQDKRTHSDQREHTGDHPTERT